MLHKSKQDHLPRLKLLGVGSAETRTLKANVKEALSQLSLDVIVDDVERLEQLMEYDISGIPALAYDGKILFQKIVPSVEELKTLFKYLLINIIPEKESEAVFHKEPKFSAMKKILFPTDFSAAAECALPFAIDLANRFGSHLQLLYAYEVRTTASTFINVGNFIQADAEQDMTKWTAKIKPQLLNGATVDTKIIKGDTIQAIISEAKYHEYNMIVMGTEGADSMLEMIMGTHANSVLRNTELPVLVIPEGTKHRPFQTIVLAVDEIEEFDTHLLKPLMILADNVAAMIRIYHKDEANDGLNTAIDAYLNGLERTYHYELDNDNFIDSLQEFVEEQDADLLCMIRRQRTFLENIFHDSATSAAAFRTKVPLLLLHDA
jgi:nucleotide-binding universal stress UspA family protein